MFKRIDYYFRRVAAYSIDILLISIVINSLVTSNKINFQYDNYNKYYDEYFEMYKSYYEHSYVNDEVNTCGEFKKAIDTYKLTDEKYVKDFEKLNDSLEKEEISKEEYDKECSSMVTKYQKDSLSSKEFKERENKYIYHLERNYVIPYIINLVVTFLYFVVFQGFTYGQTLGKKIFRLKVVNNDGEKVSYKQLFIRSLFLFSIAYYVIEMLAIFVVPMKFFPPVYNGLIFLNSCLSFVIALSIIACKKAEGIHGIISKTKVILVDFKGVDMDIFNPNKEEVKEKEEVVEDKKATTKKKTTTKKKESSKAKKKVQSKDKDK